MRHLGWTSRLALVAAMLALLSTPACAFPARLWDAVTHRGANLSLRLFHFGMGRAQPDDRPRVTRRQGRRVLDFTVREVSPGLFVQVSGEVEFERADIGFSDGSVQSVDAYGVNRDSGLFELATFPDARPVEWVRLVLRAKSRNARVGIKLAA